MSLWHERIYFLYVSCPWLTLWYFRKWQKSPRVKEKEHQEDMADREKEERETKDNIITIMEIEDMYMAIQGPELSIRIV